MDVLLEARHIRKSFDTGQGTLTVLRDVNLSIAAQERVAVVGASGSGKTTLMHILGTLDCPSDGQCFFDGVDLFSLSAAHLDAFRNATLGFVFQFHQLLPEFSALENVMMPALIHGEKRGCAQQSAEDLLGQVGLHHRLHHKPGQLSGGEQQRVAIARALVQKPQLLIADEPTGNLDSATSEEIYALLEQLHQDHQLTLVMVTHNRELASRMDRTVHIRDGELLSS
ncbi:ABC transporter ATP-binding protein [Desulfuromonas acetoxidans]|uniref:ABC transporter ATP-binding protein n=1 Tax=Desulfuromonas acetoxidans TaxID=891 RepID=UPI0029310031|nr:ABC transporter ATP-binding protein [Desulfuromonas acetoxidans]